MNLVAQEDGETLACAAAHLMRQNVRGLGRPASCLYPFRPSFYERFGLVGLSLEGLAGSPVGPGAVVVRVVDDELLEGSYLLREDGGRLVVRRAPAGGPGATVTAAGMSGLVYGVLDPVDVVVRGFGTVGDDAAAGLRVMFPRRHLAVYAGRSMVTRVPSGVETTRTSP